MSSQSVAIETLRKLRAHGSHNGHAHEPVLVESAPIVAAQLEFWYESETEDLSKQLGRAIHVRVDPMLHPEKVRVRDVASLPQNGALRVGDEHEVELLAGRLPNATSAAAVIDGRIIEVENGANMAGQTARIRLIDVEEDCALAELAAAVADKKKRRRRGRKAPLSATEENAQLRELAEEAAKFSSSRPPIGITTVTEEEERADKTVEVEERAERTPEAIVIHEGEVREGEGRNKRRRRRRGRRGRGSGEFTAADTAGIPAHSVAAQAQPGEQERDEAPHEHPHEGAEGEGHGKRRRRRRRRRGRGGAFEGAQAPGGAPQPAKPSVPDRHIFRVGADGAAEPTGETAPREPGRAIAPWNRKAAPPAVEPPPPSLRAPQEDVKPTKPARRRRTAATTEAAVAGGELARSTTRALPAPEVKPGPKRRTRKAADETPAAAEAPVKKTTRSRKKSDESAAEAPVKKTTRSRKKSDESAAEAPAKKTTRARKTSTATTTRKKKS